MNDTVYAESDDGVKGVIRDNPQEHMKMDDGRYFIPVDQDIELLRAERSVYRKALEKIVSGYSEKGPRVIAQQALAKARGESNE